jgi:2-dehydropantoate 2-reductase
MKIVIFGAGAVGGYFGGRLAQAGNEVIFIARGRHLEAIQTQGLRIESIGGDFSIRPAKATDDPGEIGVADLVLCCVKSWQVAQIAEAILPMVGPQTVVIPLQNGVEAHTTLARIVGAEHVVPGLCKIISMFVGPGHIRHMAAAPYLAFGETDGRSSPRTDEIARVFAGAKGMTVAVSQDISADLWKKFMLIAPWGGIGALTRSPVGVFRSLPETRDMLITAIREVLTVARANGVDVEESAVDATMGFLDSLPPDGTASMQRDIMDGRPSELHEQCGAVVRYGQKAGVRTPVNRFFYHSLLPLELKARGEISF